MIIFTDSKNWLECVVGAMINFETGLIYFKNGELVPEETGVDGKPKPRAPTAMYVRKTRTITIKQFGSGMLMIAGINTELIARITEVLSKMYKLAGYEDSDGGLLRRRSVHTSAEHLSSITTMVNKDNFEEGCFNAREFRELGQGIAPSGSAFTWYYAEDVDDFLSVMDHESYDTIPVTLQLSGIVYDPIGWFRFQHGEIITRNLTFRDTKWVGNRLVQTCTYGNIVNTMREAVKHDLKPTNSKRFPLLLGITVKEYERHSRNPAYIPGFTNNDSGIHICAARGPFFEIHKWLGRPEMFSDVVGIDSMFSVTIYAVELKDIVWEGLNGVYEKVTNTVAENARFKSLKPEQLCQRCLTPLYDDAYAVFADIDSKKGTPYCCVCMHQRYSESGLVDPRGNLLCNGKVLARFKPALKLADVLNMLPNQDQEYLDILQDKYTLHRYVEKENDKQGIFILRGSRFVGISKSLKKYVNLCIRWGNLPPAGLFMCQVVKVL